MKPIDEKDLELYLEIQEIKDDIMEKAKKVESFINELTRDEE